jgi:hypothetical protein
VLHRRRADRRQGDDLCEERKTGDVTTVLVERGDRGVEIAPYDGPALASLIGGCRNGGGGGVGHVVKAAVNGGSALLIFFLQTAHP